MVFCDLFTMLPFDPASDCFGTFNIQSGRIPQMNGFKGKYREQNQEKLSTFKRIENRADIICVKVCDILGLF